MPLETELAKLTAAVEANTEALRAVLAASGSVADVKIVHTITQAKPKGKPAAAPVAEEPGEEETAEAEEIVLPAKIVKKAAPAPADDTPSIPSNDNAADGPQADEHVDVDEILSQITGIVKNKIVSSSDPDATKTAWAAVRTKLGAERISDLKSERAKLLQALAAAKKL